MDLLRDISLLTELKSRPRSNSKQYKYSLFNNEHCMPATLKLHTKFIFCFFNMIVYQKFIIAFSGDFDLILVSIPNHAKKNVE